MVLQKRGNVEGRPRDLAWRPAVFIFRGGHYSQDWAGDYWPGFLVSLYTSNCTLAPRFCTPVARSNFVARAAQQQAVRHICSAYAGSLGGG